MSTDTFLSHVAGHAGISQERAERATRIVLGGLGAYVSVANRQYIADELPPALASELVAGAFTAVPLEERLLEPGVTPGRARELVASVCRVLAEELSSRALRMLRISVPRALATLLDPSEPSASAPFDSRRDTIATGKPGSKHPLSEARPILGYRH